MTRIAAALGIAGLLGACSAIGDAYDDVFSGTPELILPGQRIAILSLDRGLRPDPAVADLQVQLSEPYVNRTWTHYGGNPEHAMYHLALGDSPRQVWSADVGEGSDDDRRLLAQPLVVDGVAYTMDSLVTVSAYDTARGGLLWRSDLEPEDEDDGYFGGGIAYDAGRIYVSTGFARVFSLDA